MIACPPLMSLRLVFSVESLVVRECFYCCVKKVAKLPKISRKIVKNGGFVG